MIDINKPLALIDLYDDQNIITGVTFIQTTSKGNIQVRVPEGNDVGDDDPVRIFRTDGSHYKDDLDYKLINTGAGNVRADTINTGKDLYLATAEDWARGVGTFTKVSFVKITSKGNIQVRLPDNDDDGRYDPLRIFDLDGRSTKGTVTRILGNMVDENVVPTPNPEVDLDPAGTAAAIDALTPDYEVRLGGEIYGSDLTLPDAKRIARGYAHEGYDEVVVGRMQFVPVAVFSLEVVEKAA